MFLQGAKGRQQGARDCKRAHLGTRDTKERTEGTKVNKMVEGAQWHLLGDKMSLPGLQGVQSAKGSKKGVLK